MNKFMTSGVVLGALIAVAIVPASAIDQKPGVSTVPKQRGPVAVPAKIDVSCSDGKSYTIKTGSDGGSCTLVRDGAKTVGGYCGDTKGNGSSVFCGSGCTGATGKGECTNKQ